MNKNYLVTTVYIYFIQNNKRGEANIFKRAI